MVGSTILQRFSIACLILNCSKVIGLLKKYAEKKLIEKIIVANKQENSNGLIILLITLPIIEIERIVKITINILKTLEVTRAIIKRTIVINNLIQKIDLDFVLLIVVFYLELS